MKKLDIMFEIITGYIKQWKERRRRKSILKDIKKAKVLYLRHRSDYMCHCFFRVNFIKYWDSDKIQERIPEFNREFLNANKKSCFYGAWWRSDDRKSRIEAFDKLIEIYSRN
jgi:hypothetical protein